MTLGTITPILRIFDEPKARELYVDFLGFHVDWEPGLPLYLQVSATAAYCIYPSTMATGSPGAALRIPFRADREGVQVRAAGHRHAAVGTGSVGTRSVWKSADVLGTTLRSHRTRQFAPLQGEWSRSPKFTSRRFHMRSRVLGFSLVFVIAALTLPTLAQDPVKVDPKHYKVEFENDQVRVLRISYGPHEKSVMHEHPNAVAVFLTTGDGKFTFPDGKTQAMTMKAGSAMWTPAGPHLPENTGDKPFELILVELKGNAPAAK